jgi:aspartyl-tRNA(Asn)/glutamyl-tRNA(Gln) amidotransferase subunit C
MMEVNDAMFDRLAKLARLKFDGEEREKIKTGLQAMIGMVKKLDEVNTEGIEPLLHISGNINMMRDDMVQGSVSNEDALKNAVQKQAPYFIVPKVIKK